MKFRALIDRVFHLEEINGGEMCPRYMYRWTLAKLGRMASVYLHKFVADDWSRDKHDHPKRFISIGIWGSYFEETPNGVQVFAAPWVRSFPATHIHRISLIGGKPCWTICIVLRAVREWGFWHDGTWIHWRRYVRSDAARKMKSCA